MDGYDNLILLCASDHRLIDSQPGRFPTATVCELKGAHERWVEQSLQVSVRAQSETVQLRMTHARTGKELLDAVAAEPVKLFETSGDLNYLCHLLGLDGRAWLVDPYLVGQGRG